MGSGLADDLAAVGRSPAVAPEGGQQHGHAGLGLHKEGAHDGVQVRARSPAGTPREVEDVLVGRRRAVILAIDRETGTRERRQGRREPSPRRRRGGNQTGQGGDAKVLERIASTPQGGIVQMAGWERRSEEPKGRGRREKGGPQVPGLVHQAEPIEAHRLDRMASGHHPHGWVLLGRFSKDFGNAEVVTPARAQAQVIYDLGAGRLGRGRDRRAVRVSQSLLLCRGMVSAPKNDAMRREGCGMAGVSPFIDAGGTYEDTLAGAPHDGGIA